MSKPIVIQRGDKDTIPVTAFDFTRWNNNPILFQNHNWSEQPIGHAAQLQSIDGELYIYPKLHCKNAPELLTALEKGYLKAYPAGTVQRDATGAITKFTVFEISLCI